jgi:hypothetical protein
MQDNYYKELKRKLEKRNQSLKEKLVMRHKDAFDWAQSNTKQIAAGAMGSILLLTSPMTHLLPKHDDNSVQSTDFVDVPENIFVVNDVKQFLPDTVGQLTTLQEEKISQVLSDYYGFPVKNGIDGFRLNTTYGYIGLEQHLMRFPGDSVENMAPGRGGFGYFAHSKNEMTQKDIEREKYYIAVQSFLAPGFSERTREYINFLKYRKMLVVNPNSGRAVVADIADAGPAVWTGKHLGGSPEVMQYLERVDGRAKGPVLYFFIDDPEDKIPLGPIEPVS